MNQVASRRYESRTNHIVADRPALLLLPRAGARFVLREAFEEGRRGIFGGKSPPRGSDPLFTRLSCYRTSQMRMAAGATVLGTPKFGYLNLRGHQFAREQTIPLPKGCVEGGGGEARPFGPGPGRVQ
jgi:hypothetical protein